MDDDLRAYYARGEEQDRLAAGFGLVEFLRTIEIIGRMLPPTPARIADIGGGPGRYTDWLIELGYDVVHRDLMDTHVDAVAQRHGEKVDAAVGDARALDLSDVSCDAVLLLGPMYHLVDEGDRVRALREARRIAKPGAPIYIAVITRWAPRLHGMIVDQMYVKYPAATEMVDEMETTGWMKPIHPTSFNGFAHTPDQLRAEIAAAGLSLDSLVCVEGISFTLGDIRERMDDPAQRVFLLDMLRKLEDVPDLMGIGPHLLATARA